MPIILKAGNIAPIPAGMHHAICYAVADIGTQPVTSPKVRPSRKVVLTFELPDELGEFERDGQKVTLPRAISRVYGKTIGRKATLRHELESWRGREFTEAELKSFDLKNVLGANCQLNIVHANKAGDIYANLQNIAPLAKGMPKREPVNKPLYFALDEFLAAGGKDWPANMPDWLRAKVMQSDEYLMAMQTEAQPMQPPVDADEAAPEGEDVPF